MTDPDASPEPSTAPLERTPRSSPLADTMGIVLRSATPDRVVATMPVEGNTQPYGLLHGGATCVLAETLGSVGAALYAGKDRAAVGIELNATHHRGASAGLLTGVATPLHRGRSVATYEIVVTDAADRRIATARLTCMLIDAPGADAARDLALPTG